MRSFGEASEQPSGEAGGKVTLIIFFFNQSRFADEAIEGALAQTHTPLEIILSDDCSTDGTFEIISRKASEYKGPHKLLVNRNSRNLGIGPHVNLLVEMAQGDLIVGAAGDDVSLPERVSRIYEAWRDNGFPTGSIYSDAVVIDEKGNPLESTYYHEPPEENKSLLSRIENQASGVMGCTHAWTRNLFEAFGPLNDDVVAEDRTIPFRSYLIGRVIGVDHKLVRYRIHDNNVFNMKSGKFDYRRILQRAVRFERIYLSTYRQYRKDLLSANSEKPIPDMDQAMALIDRKISELRIRIDFNQGSFFSKMIAIGDALYKAHDIRLFLKLGVKFLFPPLNRLHYRRIWMKEQ